MKKPRYDIPSEELIKLNSLGYSLRTIAKIWDCHQSTITHRLAYLGIAATDARRIFMEDILSTLTKDQIEWLSEQLGPHTNIKQYIKDLIVTNYIKIKDTNE